MSLGRYVYYPCCKDGSEYDFISDEEYFRSYNIEDGEEDKEVEEEKTLAEFVQMTKNVWMDVLLVIMAADLGWI